VVEMKSGRAVSSLSTLLVCLAAALGCAPSDRSDQAAGPLIARERHVRPRVEKRTPMRPLTPAIGAPPVAPAPPSTELRLTPGLPVDARALVITADGTESAFDAIKDMLGYLGTPYDVLNATTDPTLTAATLADGDHGKYYAIFLDVGDLSSNGQSAFTNDEWLTLSSYEARFGVRRVAAYTYPTSAYGLVSAGAAIQTPILAHCRAAAPAAFAGMNCANPLQIDAGYSYPARAANAQTVPLLVDDAGNVYAAIVTYPDGREALVLTFSQATYVFHTPVLGYGLVSWATRGLFIGERHAYLSAQIDDLFLASDIYPDKGLTYRMTDHDMQALADWQNGRRANPMTAGLRLAWAANLQGSGSADPLTAKAVALGTTFEWISHTWDHADMTNQNYAKAYTEFTQNDQTIRHLGLTPYATQNLVTPGITGLDNAAVMQAAYDVGIRQLVSDTSVDGQDNPTPNAGIRNALVPGILEIPRYPTDLDYDTSTPEEWTAADNARDMKTQTYEEIVADESRVLARYLMRGANDPWMFHQANTRDYGGGRSMLGDLLGATIDVYLASMTTPVVSPTMDELAVRVTDRMRLDASGVVATIQPGSTVTVQVANAARVPITGVCTPGAERYGGQTITYLDLPAGGSMTLSLTDCNPGATGTAGAGGGGGAGGSGAAGAGGNSAAGSGGNGGATTGTGGVSGTGMGGTIGAAGAAGTGGESGIGTGGVTGTAGTTGIGGTGGGGGASTGIGGTSGGAGNAGNAGTTGGAGTTGAAGTTGGGGATGTGTGGGGATGGGSTSGGGSNGSISGTGGVGPIGGGGVTGVDAGIPTIPQPSGCGCAVNPSTPGPGLGVVLIAGGLVFARRRRR
jgi:MYXO-CTERM domain-containing protein